MGAFFLARHQPGDPANLAAQARASLQRQGFGHLKDLSHDSFTLLYARKQHVHSDSVYVRDAQNFCLSTGTLIYRGSKGADAARQLFLDHADQCIDATRLFGNFALLCCHDGLISIYNDHQGVYPVWHDSEFNRFSSSFMLLAELLEKPRLHREAVYPYVFQEGCFGGDTLLQGLQRLQVGHAYRLEQTARRVRPLPYQAPNCLQSRQIQPHLDELHDRLSRQFEAICGCFGDNVDSALSGGYDSRLLLALCREQGSTPHLHVYGAPESADVKVAQRLCEGENIPLKHQDKGHKATVTPEQFGELVEQNLWAFQGPCADGILDNGSDRQTRLERTRGGRLLLNGGGGEVLRNFFYLPDKNYSARQILWSFYSQFDPKVCTNAWNEEAYYQRLEQQTAELVGTDEPLDRQTVEYLYAGFRCTYWMGHNNAINNQFGWFLTPFVESNIARQAHLVPMPLKEHGRLEAALIDSISPELAAYPSDYGHDFAHPPPRKRQLKDWATLIRPPRLRRYTYRLKRRDRSQWPYFLEDSYLRALFPDGLQYMPRYFQLDKVMDAGQFKRICTLEYLLRTLDAAD